MRLDHPQTSEFIEMASLRERSWPHYTRVQRRALVRLAAILARPLTIGVAGEAGTGKSALLNALLGAAIIPVGGLGRVRPVFRARYGGEYAAYSIKEDGSRQQLTSKDFERASAGQAAFAGRHPMVIYDARGVTPRAVANPATGVSLVEVYSPAPLLKQVEFVELPVPFGAAPVLSPATRRFARADIVIWTTPAHQAWKRSELLAWQDLCLAPPDRSILAATLKDGLAAAQDQERLSSRLTRDTETIFAACHLVSAQQALDGLAKRAGAAELQNSGLPQLENTIQQLVLAVRQARLTRARSILERIERGDAGSLRLTAASDPSQQASQDRSAASLHSAG